MRQGWKLLSLCAALALMIAASSPTVYAAKSKSARTSKESVANSRAQSKNSLRQFTGVVTKHDENSITVVKNGKKPTTMVFEKHEEMKTKGDVKEDARVTVFYRESDGRAVAHRVVVKTKKPGSGRSR